MKPIKTIRNIPMHAVVVPWLICLLMGCPYTPEVTVTIKPAAGEEEAQQAGENLSNSEATAEGFGNLFGTITFDGALPASTFFVRKGDPQTKDASVCAAQDIPVESLIVDSQTKGIANVVIFLAKKPKHIKPELAQPPQEPIYFDQKGCRFFPHVLAFRVGQPVLILSGDPIAHNTHTFPVRNSSFNQGIEAGNRKGTPINYTSGENKPLEVKCDLHPWMKAYHFPVDHPYFAVTDKQGKFHIPGLPAGRQAFNIWHETVGLLERKLKVTIQPDTDVELNRDFGAAKFAAATRSIGRTVSLSHLKQRGKLVTEIQEVR